MTLTELPAGQDARVTSVNGTGRVTRRLLEMGVIPGVTVKVVKTAPFGDPIDEFDVRYTLGFQDRDHIINLERIESDGVIDRHTSREGRFHQNHLFSGIGVEHRVHNHRGFRRCNRELGDLAARAGERAGKHHGCPYHRPHARRRRVRHALRV